MKILLNSFFAVICLFTTQTWAADLLGTAPLGWGSIPNTKIRTVCPNIASLGNCQYVVDAWNSAVFDTQRNRMLIWGGGHNDYLGNEIYSLDLSANPITMTRITEPSLKTIAGRGATGDSPAQASARHTYDHIVYMSHVDGMYVFGGASPVLGFFLTDTWLFSFPQMRWIERTPTAGPTPEQNYGRVTVYNPVTQKVYIHDQTTLYSYSYETNQYTVLSTNVPAEQELTGVFDSKRQRFFMIGNGKVYYYDVSASSTYVLQTWATTGGSAVINGNNPGVAYDVVQDKIVGWDGGNTVYLLDPSGTSKAWTPVTFSGGPGSASGGGTFKRFAYSPTSNAFVLVNSVDSNAYSLKLTLGSGSNPPPQITSPKNLRVQ